MLEPTLPDFLFLGLFAVALPAWDYLVWWPALERRFLEDPARARLHLWRSAIAYPWTLVGLATVLSVLQQRSMTTLLLSAPGGWRSWLALCLIALLVLYYAQAVAAVRRDVATRAAVAAQFTGELANVLPRTAGELTWFCGVAVTAGVCEELLYRGIFIWTLSPWLGWWGAAALSLVTFALGHAYQGRSGILRTATVGAVFTALVALLDSLWPAMVLHALLDLGSGVLAWLVLRQPGHAAA